MDRKLRRVVTFVALINLTYFVIEFGAARAIGSVSLFADSVDFLEDASLNLLIAVSLSWSVRSRARLGMGLAGIILVPGVATLWTAWTKFHTPLPPSAVRLTVTAAGALMVNLLSALILARHRNRGGSLTRAAFLSSRNDVLANVAMIASGLITSSTHSGWADLLVGLGIAGLNMDAALKVWQVARAEHRSASVDPV